jgi:hypothetical protein
MLELVVPVLPDKLTENWRKVVRDIDLLDIPGMLAEKAFEGGKRENAKRIEERMEIVKRGKVLYLFEHYIEEHQIQTLLLLTRYGNVQVKDQIKYYVNLWGRARYGAKLWPKGVEGDPPALFMGMTGIDAEIREKREVPDDEFRRFYENRIMILRDILGSAVLDDFGGRRFTNIYPIRYPGSWDSTTEERRTRGQEDKWRRAGEGFLRSAQVQSHVKAPEQRWQAAMNDHDGGINIVATGFLAGTGVVAKQDHLKRALEQTQEQLFQMAQGWVIPENINLEREKRLSVAQQVLDWLGSDEDLIYYRAQALKESLCFREADIWDLADASEAFAPAARHSTSTLAKRFPAILREFLRVWSLVTTQRRWEMYISASSFGGPWLDVSIFGLVANYLVDYLCTDEAFEPLVSRLLPIVGLRLKDEAACQHARRKYVRLILNDFMMNPGPSRPAGSTTAVPNGHDFGTMQAFYDQWRERLPACLALGASAEVKIPAGNSQLIALLRRRGLL